MGTVVREVVAAADGIHREFAQGRITTERAERGIGVLNQRLEELGALPREVLDAWVLLHGVGVAGLPLGMVVRQLGMAREEQADLESLLASYGLTARERPDWSLSMAEVARLGMYSWRYATRAFVMCAR